jgi:hypothetical protein
LTPHHSEPQNVPVGDWLQYRREKIGQIRSDLVTVCGNDALQALASVDREVPGAAAQASVEVQHNLAGIAQELGVMGVGGLHGVAKQQE